MPVQGNPKRQPKKGTLGTNPLGVINHLNRVSYEAVDVPWQRTKGPVGWKGNKSSCFVLDVKRANQGQTDYAARS